MSNEPNSDEPKIIIDEDWKSQVQAEKEALAAQAGGDQSNSQAATTAEPAAESSSQAAADAAAASAEAEDVSGEQPLPPPDLAMLFTSLATQAMFALGRIPDPRSGQTTVRLDEARHVIDTLQLLEDKTQGNRTPQESALLTRILYELRMEYVAQRDRK